MEQEPLLKRILRVERVGKFVSFLLFLVFCLRAPLITSLWLDETITFWLTKVSFKEAFWRAWEYQAQSPLYYIFAWCIAHACSFPELVLRLLSLLLFGATLWVYAKIGEELQVKSAAYLFPLVAIFDFAISSNVLSARPYALAFFFTHLSLLLFLRVLKSFNSILVILYQFSVLLCFYFHYLFLLSLVLHGFLLFTSEKRTTFSLRSIGTMYFPIGVGLIPGIFHIVHWQRKKEIFNFFPPIEGGDIVVKVFPLVPLLFFLLSWLSTFIVQQKERQAIKRLPGIIPFALLWTFFPPLFFLLWAKVGGGNLFIERYFLWHIGGASLLIALFFDTFFSEKRKILFLSSWCIVGSSFLLQLPWEIEDWKGASQHLSSLDVASPVLLHSGLIELSQERFPQDPVFYSYVSAPFEVYPIPQPILIVPISTAAELHRQYLEEKVLPKIIRNEQLYYVFPYREDSPTEDSTESIIIFLKGHGWCVQEFRRFGVVTFWSLTKKACEGRSDKVFTR